MPKVFLISRKGTDIASAGTITPPADGDRFNVTGTTGITTINAGGRGYGARIRLYFEGVVTVTHSSGLVLQGAVNFTSAAGDMLTLEYTSAGWAEIGRSTAAAPAGGDFMADGSVPLTGDLDAGGNQLTNLGAPASGSDAATKTYVDNIAIGLKWKAAVRVATTVAGTLATSFENGDTVDGITLATNDRILIKNQAAPTENGIYTVNASGAPTRATDLDTAAAAAGVAVFVQEGTANADKGFVCTSNSGSDVVGTNNLAFAQFTTLVAGDIKSDGSVPFAADQSMGGNKLTDVDEPTQPDDAATAGYADRKSWKTAVRVATVIAGTLASDFENGDTVDGVVLATGDRILVKNQATASENGIYIVAASGAPARAADLATGDAANGTGVYVGAGTVHAGKVFVCSSAPGSDVVGTNNLLFRVVSGGGIYVNADGATVTIDLAESVRHEITLGGDRTLAVTNELPGQPLYLRVIQDGTGTRVPAFWSTINWAGGAPTLTTTAGAVDEFMLICTAAGTWSGFILGLDI